MELTTVLPKSLLYQGGLNDVVEEVSIDYQAALIAGVGFVGDSGLMMGTTMSFTVLFKGHRQ